MQDPFTEDSHPMHPLSLSGADASMKDLVQGTTLGGFRATAVYLDAAERPIGGRFIHTRCGFTLDFLQIDTAPQAYIWVNTIPRDDKGLPHTQEHLLLGKGNKGRYVAALQDMSLVSSSAFTAGLHTAYHLHTTAGTSVFFDVLENKLDALLHPDYTDEEIRREVHHFGVTGSPGALEIEEKGTIYNEMASSHQRPWTRLWRALQETLYGQGHPRACSSGGIPDAIRDITPRDIRVFHRAHYRLDNAGIIAVLPTASSLGSTLSRMDVMLRALQQEETTDLLEADTILPHQTTEATETNGRLETGVPLPNQTSGPAQSTGRLERPLPPPKPGHEGALREVPYPSHETSETVDVVFAWPPLLELDSRQNVLLARFLTTFAGDSSTNLYKRIVDSKTRWIDVEARRVSAWTEANEGSPVYVRIGGIPASAITPELTLELRKMVIDEFVLLASRAPDDPDLNDFNQRLKTNLIAFERSARQYVNEPPGFGWRQNGPGWFEHLRFLQQTPEFRKSIPLAPELRWAREQLKRKTNIWAEFLPAWGLTQVTPYTLSTRPSPEEHAHLERSRKARAEAFVTLLLERFGTSDRQRAIAAYKAEYDEATADLEAQEVREVPRFIQAPPMTEDDVIDTRVDSIPGTGIPRVASVFDNMSGATVGLALRLEAVTEKQYCLLGALPSMLSAVGILEEGVPIPHEEVIQRLRREILGLRVYLSANPDTKRHELVVQCRGTTPEESALAVAWMGRFLYQADWRPENLPRLRDLVDQRLDRLRHRTRRSEEHWVHNPAAAYRWQSDPIYLATSSFLTELHNTLRLRWALRECQGTEVPALLVNLADAPETLERDGLAALVGALRGQGEASEAARPWLAERDRLEKTDRKLVAELARDLETELSTLPDESLAKDWSYLCLRLAVDLSIEPKQVLERLVDLRDKLLFAANARMWTVGAESTLRTLEPDIAALVATLNTGAAPPAEREEFPHIWERLTERGVDTTQRVFVGLVQPNMQGGVFIHTAPGPRYEDTGSDRLLELLTLVSLAGRGAHSIFMRTWGAGLAYSNGVNGGPRNGRLVYYAERCPSLPQTLQFVIDDLERAEPDPHRGEYAIAHLFSSRVASGYGARGAAAAADLADGISPVKVATFRRAILAQRERKDLHEAIHAGLRRVMGTLLPGYGAPSSGVRGAAYVVIGTEAHLDEYEAWLRKAEGEEVVLHRLYPRDFWMAAPP